MASSLVTSMAPLEDIVPKGTRRSRLSVHLNTPRRRRWLLVQLVTLPNYTHEEKREDQHAAPTQPKSPAYDYNRLMGQYEASRMVRRVI